MLLVTGCIVEYEEPSGKAICSLLEDINCAINLHKQIICQEPAISTFAGLEYNASITKTWMCQNVMQLTKRFHTLNIILQSPPINCLEVRYHD